MRKIISIILSFGLLFQQSGLVYAVGELNLANYLSQAKSAIVQPDQFRPAQLRYISYDIKSNDFKLLLDKGGAKLNELSNSLNSSTPKLNDATQELFNYFLVGLSLPNDTFWVNLRPDAPENIIDPLLEKTDIGKIFLEADLQLKKDTASLTSPQNPEGKSYWDKLYKKAGELFGTENITIPTITRPWIVPNEVIVRETEDSAYIYKATLKVMLEADYLNGRGGLRTAPTPDQYAFSDPRLKELNEYSSQIIRETIIPKLTKEVNSSKRYAQLRQVYYSLVLARWFKQKYSSLGSAGASANSYLGLIDSGNLANLVSQQPCDKQTYFQAYQKSFKDGEYNLKETVPTPFGQSIRSYISGGLYMTFADSSIAGIKVPNRTDVTETLTGHANSPLTPNKIKELADIAGKTILKYKNEFERICKSLSVQDKQSLDEIDKLLNDNGQNYLQSLRSAAIKLSGMFFSRFTNQDPNSIFGKEAKEIEDGYLTIKRAEGAIDFLIKEAGAGSPLTEAQKKLIRNIGELLKIPEINKSWLDRISIEVIKVLNEIPIDVKVKAGVGKITEDTILNDLEMDSLDISELFLLLEEFFSAEFIFGDEGDLGLGKFWSDKRYKVKDLIKYLHDRPENIYEYLMSNKIDKIENEFFMAKDTKASFDKELKDLFKQICRVGVDDLLKKVPRGAPMDKINEIKKSINKDKIGDAAFKLGQVLLSQVNREKADACNSIWKAWQSVAAGSPLMTKVEFLSKINLIQEEVLKSFGKGNDDYYYDGGIYEYDTYVISKVWRRTGEKFPEKIKFSRRIDGGNIVEISAPFLSPDLFYTYIIPAIDTILPGIEYPLWQEKPVIRIRYEDYKNLTPEAISKFKQSEYPEVINSAYKKILPVKKAGQKQEALTIKEMQKEIKAVLRALLVTARAGEDFLQIDKLLTMLRVMREHKVDSDVDKLFSSEQTHEEYPDLYILNDVFERLKEFRFKDGKHIHDDIKAISVAKAIQEVFAAYCKDIVLKLQNDSLLERAQKDNFRSIEENGMTADKAGELIKIIDWLLEKVKEREGAAPIFQIYKDNLLFIQEVTSPRAAASPLVFEEVNKLDGMLGGFIENVKSMSASSDFVNAIMEYKNKLKGVTSITDFNALLKGLIVKCEEMYGSYLNRILGDAGGGYSGEIALKLEGFKKDLQELKNNQLRLVDNANVMSLSAITLNSGVNVRLNGWGPETLREVLKNGQPIDLVVCPPQLYRNGVEYGSPEFLVNYNLFRAPAAPDAPINLGWRRGNYTFLVAQDKEQKEAIERIISRSFLGSPREFYEKIQKGEINIDGISSDDISSADIEHFMRNRTKFPTIGDSLEIEQFVKVYVLGEEFDYKTRIGRDLKLKIERDDNGRYRITETVNGQAQVYQNIAVDEYRPPVMRSIAVTNAQIDAHNFLNRPEFGYTILGDSHGFDPYGNNTSILVSAAGKYLLIDGSPATYQITKDLKIPSLDIEYVFLTHTHDDHDAILNRVLNGFPVKLIATPAVYANFVAKANDKLKLYGQDINIGEWVDYIKILPGQRLPIFNGKAVIECPSFYNKHTLPTSAVKIGYIGEGGDIESSISYTADTQLDPNVWEFVKGSNVIFHDAGILPLHPSPEGVAKQITDKELRRRVILVHASDEDVKKAGSIGLTKGDVLKSTTLIPADLSARIKDNDNISKCLAAVAYLSSLSSEALQALAKKTRVRNFLPGNKIVKQGETTQSLQPSADVLYLIVSGEAKVNIGGEEIRLKPGMTFGEFSAVNPLQPRSVDVVAGDNGLVAISFSKAAITALIKDFPEVRESVERIQHNLLYLERLSEIEKSPFNQLPIEVLYDLAEKLKVVEFEKGKDILIEGEQSGSEGAYIITEGYVEVASKSVGKLKEIYDSSPDNVFGEGAFFNPGGKRNATVTAMTKVKALHITSADFQKALEHHPSLKYKFYVLSANRGDENANGHHRKMAVGSPLTLEQEVDALIRSLPNEMYEGLSENKESSLLEKVKRARKYFVEKYREYSDKAGALFNSQVDRETDKLSAPGGGFGVFVSERTSNYLRASDLRGKYKNLWDDADDLVKKLKDEGKKTGSAGSPLLGVFSAIGTQEDVSVTPKRGGIDLTDRMLKIKLERVGSFALSALALPEITNLEALDLDEEYERIQAMASVSIRPSDTRILEFAAACYYRGEFDQRLAQVSSCIKAAHLADEISGRDSSEALRLATMLPDALYGG